MQKGPFWKNFLQHCKDVWNGHSSNQCGLQKYRSVGQLEGRELARSVHAPFIECSAAERVNVDVAFNELVKLVRKDERVRINYDIAF